MLWNVCGLHLMKNGGMPSAYWSRFRQQNQNGMWERAMNVYTNIVLIMNRRAKCVSESQAKEGTVIISARKAKSMTRTEAIERLMYLRDEIMPISSTMFGALTMAIQALEEQPKTGKWIFDGDCYKCNKCGAVYGWWADSQTPKYCPNCGCRMLKEGEEHD